MPLKNEKGCSEIESIEVLNRLVSQLNLGTFRRLDLSYGSVLKQDYSYYKLKDEDLEYIYNNVVPKMSSLKILNLSGNSFTGKSKKIIALLKEKLKLDKIELNNAFVKESKIIKSPENIRYNTNIKKRINNIRLNNLRKKYILDSKKENQTPLYLELRSKKKVSFLDPNIIPRNYVKKKITKPNKTHLKY